MNDPGQTVERRSGMRDFLAGYDDSADFGELPTATDATAGLISLGFIGSALRRAMSAWLAMAVIGLFVGVGLALEHEGVHSAAVTVLLDTAGESQTTQSGELATDAAIAESTPVAAAVIAQLGIQETPVSFLGTYSAAPLGDSDQVLTITAQGPTDEAAVQRASAIATQFLTFRARYLQQGLKQTVNSINQQVSEAQQNLNSVNEKIREVSAEPDSSSQQTELAGLQRQQTEAANALSTVTENANGSQLEAETQTTQMVKGSEVLSAAAPVKHSAKKTLALYGVGGLIVGLVIGMAIVAIAAITSDRLRRRDDIAIAVGAPVGLSVGRLRGRRWVLDPRARSGHRNRDMKRVVEHLRNAVPANSQGAASLAVVAVDDAPTVAQAVIRLAIASSQQRKRVVLADLSVAISAARQLGVAAPGISTVSPEGVPIVVVVPESEDVAPVGPLRNPSTGSARVSERLAGTCAQADLVISVVTLNPAFGGDYLGSWATDAVAVVTAGQSTATRLHAAGEMIRLAGVRLGSVVVLGADRNDESLGTVVAEYQPAAAVQA